MSKKSSKVIEVPVYPTVDERNILVLDGKSAQLLHSAVERFFQSDVVRPLRDRLSSCVYLEDQFLSDLKSSNCIASECLALSDRLQRILRFFDDGLDVDDSELPF